MAGSVVTILFADLVGSIVMLERDGDETAAAARGEHLAALRRAVTEHDGHEIRCTVDGLMVTFASTVAAVRCAVDMQHATAAGPLELRIGIDAGEPLAATGDLYGTPVIVASRLCDSAETGEILASEVVCTIAGHRVAEPIERLAPRRLRGLHGRVPVGRVRWDADADPASDEHPELDRQHDITVAIVDDERLIRAGFRVILDNQPDIVVVGEAADGRSAVDLVMRRRPDVVLMDIRMPELDGLSAAERLLSNADVRSAVIMLTTFDRDEYIYDALRIGASGFLLKEAPAERLIDAVRVAAAGDALLEPSITRRLVQQFARAARPAPEGIPAAFTELTTRELEVLTLLARGLSNAEIADELTLGTSTIKSHVASVLGKLGLRDRVQAVVLAYETELVRPDLSPSD